MKKALSLVAALALVGAMAGSAAAQDRARRAPAPTPAPTEQVTEFSFDDDLVTGDLVRPDGEIMTARRRNPRSTLIRPRWSFANELRKSVERL